MAVDRLLRADWQERDHVQRAAGQGNDRRGTRRDPRAESAGPDSAPGRQLRLSSRKTHSTTSRRTRHRVRLHPAVLADIERNRTAVERRQTRDFTDHLRGQRSLQLVPYRDVSPAESPTEFCC